MKVFADDMKVYIELRDCDCIGKLHTVLNLIENWAADWQLPISITKTNIFNIGVTSFNAAYCMCNAELPVVTSSRDLGITATNDLTSAQHISDITAKAHQGAN